MPQEMDLSHDADELARSLGSWSGGSGALYRKLARALRQLIFDGGLSLGERLPAERRLATALAVSRTTVVAAYDELRTEGVLDSRRGSGTRVSAAVGPRRSDGWVRGGRASPLYQRLLDGPGELISLSCVIAEAAPEVGEAARAALTEDLPGLLGDPEYHPRGLPALREAIAEHYTVRGLPTYPEQIVVTTGAQQAVALVSQLYLRDGSPALVESPGFAGCIDLLRAAGAEPSAIPLDEEGADANATRRAFERATPHLLYVMPTYHNPTGTLMSPARRRHIAELAARYGVPVLEDNAYAGVGRQEEPPPLGAFAPAGSETLTVESMSKVAWTGLRVGWVRAPLEIAERLSRRKVLSDLGSPVLDQAIAARLVPRLAEIARSRSEVMTERMVDMERRLRERLPEWRWRTPDGGLALWVELPGTNAQTFAQVALRHGVELVPGAVMAPGGDFSSFFRLPFGFDRQRRAELVHRLARAWEEFRRHGPCEVDPLRVVV